MGWSGLGGEWLRWGDSEWGGGGGLVWLCAAHVGREVQRAPVATHQRTRMGMPLGCRAHLACVPMTLRGLRELSMCLAACCFVMRGGLL